MSASILVVEDQGIVAQDIRESLERMGYRVPVTVPSGEEALEQLAQTEIDLVLMDVRLRGELDGLQTAGLIRQRYQTPVVYLSAYSDEDTLRRAKESDPFGYLIKPFEARELATTIELALHRHELERLLSERETWLTTILESIADAIIVTDAAGAIRFVNPRAWKLTGWQPGDVEGAPLEEVFQLREEATGGPAANPVRQVLETGRLVPSDIAGVYRRADGVDIPIEVSSAPLRNRENEFLGAVLVFRDVTVRRRLAQSELQLQKLKSLEVVAGGLGHDFHNLLMIILSYTQLIRKKGVVPEIGSYVSQIEVAGHRAAGLTRQIMTFSGNDPVTLVPVDLSQLVEETVHLLTDLSPPGVQVNCDLVRELPTISGDPGKLHRLVMNMLTNAFEAIGEASGEVRLRTSLSRIERDLLDCSLSDGSLVPGPYVVLEIADDGCGMDRDTMERVFDPFFSTKFTGRGLGMAAAFGIMRQHRGGILIDSEPGEGTRFRLLFPVR